MGFTQKLHGNPFTQMQNTDLDVEKSHQIDLVYNYYSQRFMLSMTAGYDFCNNEIAQYSFIDDDNLLNETYGNVQKYKRVKLNIFANWLMFKKTRLMLNQNVNYTDMRSEQLGMKNSEWGSYTMLNLQPQRFCRLLSFFSEKTFIFQLLFISLQQIASLLA